MDRLLIIIATRDVEKIRMAVKYAAYPKDGGWMDDVEIIFFGSSEKVLASNPDLLNSVVKNNWG